MNDYRKRLYRSSKGQMVAGVCTGIGEYLNVDANLIRLGFAVLTVFGGLGILLYLVAWVILPEEGQDTSIAENMLKSKRKS